MTSFDIQPNSKNAIIAGNSTDMGILNQQLSSFLEYAVGYAFPFIQVFNNDLDPQDRALQEFGVDGLNGSQISVVKWGSSDSSVSN